jgi:hypothetical protein
MDMTLAWHRQNIKLIKEGKAIGCVNEFLLSPALHQQRISLHLLLATQIQSISKNILYTSTIQYSAVFCLLLLFFVLFVFGEGRKQNTIQDVK